MFYLKFFILIKGPHPATVVCDDPDVNDFCKNFQNEEWLSVCDEKVTSDFKESLIRACVIDLCETNTEETKHQIVSAYVNECKKDGAEDFLCDWETQFFGNEPTCEANEEYKGLTLTSLDISDVDTVWTWDGQTSTPPGNKYLSEIFSLSHIKPTNYYPYQDFKSVKRP